MLEYKEKAEKTMNRNNLIISMAVAVTGLLLSGCTVADDDNMASQGDPAMAETTGRYEAQWQVDRTVVDTTTFQVTSGRKILVSHVPTDWLLEHFMPAEARNGFVRSLPMLQLAYQPVGYYESNSYFSTQSINDGNWPTSMNAIIASSPQTLFFIESKVVDMEVNAPTNEVMAEHPDSLFVLDDSYLLTVCFSLTESAGVYDGQHDAWTMAFAIDSVAVDYAAVVGQCDANGQIVTANAPRTYRKEERLPSPVRLNLVTTKRKN